ncbi:hypothetical protein RIF29_25378 [Crotalaria pallida]|uniref:Uncharacterized protein n=1 Tax=Crotalaria pallida TaxID=3830 RepID=A0AAN9I116_CROPI
MDSGMIGRYRAKWKCPRKSKCDLILGQAGTLGALLGGELPARAKFLSGTKLELAQPLAEQECTPHRGV